jgi:hypothetical protein
MPAAAAAEAGLWPGSLRRDVVEKEGGVVVIYPKDRV